MEPRGVFCGDGTSNVLWLCCLGGKLGLSSELDGSFVLLAGIAAVSVTAAALAFAFQHLFPRA
jgi:hypothetical protein